MSRAFVRASSQYLESTSVPATDYPLTLAAWVKLTSAPALMSVVALGATGTPYVILGVTGSAQAFCEVSGSTTADAFGGTVATGSWVHVAAVLTNSTSRKCFVNGVAGTPDTVAVSLQVMNRTNIGCFNQSGARAGYLDGLVDYATIWTSALSDANIASLAAGAVPSTIGAPADYWPLDGTTSPEPDSGTANLPLTVTGAAQGGTRAPVSAATTYTRSGPIVVGP